MLQEGMIPSFTWMFITVDIADNRRLISGMAYTIPAEVVVTRGEIIKWIVPDEKEGRKYKGNDEIEDKWWNLVKRRKEKVKR